MLWLFLAILAPAIFSITIFIDKFLVEKKIKDPIVITIFGGLTTMIVGIIILIYKGFHPIALDQLLLLLLSGILLDLYLIPYFKALAIEDASRVTPLFQFVPIFVLLLSYIFLHESLTQKQIIGFFIILIGGFILGAEKIEKKLFKPRRSFYFMIIASFMYALTTIIFKFIVITQDFLLTLGYESIGLGIGSMILLCFSQYRHSFTKELKKVSKRIYCLLTLNSAINDAGQFVFSFAFLLAPVSLVSVVGGIQPLFVLMYGVILSLWFPHLIKEDLTRSTLITKLVAIIPLIIGVLLIYL